MATRIAKALQSKEATKLITAGLSVASTDRQIDNGTIAFAGHVNGRPVRYEITASGALISNKFVARKLHGEYPLDQYQRGLRAAVKLLDKRLARGA
jgi:hypothetical protein